MSHHVGLTYIAFITEMEGVLVAVWAHLLFQHAQSTILASSGFCAVTCCDRAQYDARRPSELYLDEDSVMT